MDGFHTFCGDKSCRFIVTFLGIKGSCRFIRNPEDPRLIICFNRELLGSGPKNPGSIKLNNINRFLQESNPNSPVEWGVQKYKVGDPVLFLENNRFHPVIYNNMRGKIVGIEKLDTDTPNERIQFDIELNTTIDHDEVRFMPLEILDNPVNDNTVVRFSVYKVKSTDEDDDGNTARTIVPFQIAYAVSIHKAQGLEYDSVKIVITDEVDELITHNIFYTAITRAKNKLKIYWTPEVEKKVLKRIRPRNIDADVEILKKYL